MSIPILLVSFSQVAFVMDGIAVWSYMDSINPLPMLNHDLG